MAESPYRSAPKAELTFEAGPSQSVVFALLGGGTVIYGLQYFVSGLVLVLVAALVAALLIPLVVYTSKRNHWRFTLERQNLRVDRLLPAGTKRLGTLDVSKGVSMIVDVPEEDAAVEPRLRLSGGGQQIAFRPGSLTRTLYDELARFLRENEVEVEAPELPDLPGDSVNLPKL